MKKNKLRIGLIGQNIAHSKLFDFYRTLIPVSCDYITLDIKREKDLPNIFDLKKDFYSLNITSPYKEHYASSAQISPQAIKDLKAINCLSLQQKPIKGTNTDYLALKDIFRELQQNRQIQSIFILGSGVMSKLTQTLLNGFGLPYQVLARSCGQDIAQKDFSSYQHALIINACSRSFVFSGTIHQTALFWDYNYFFEPHRQHFEKHNLTHAYKDGLSLLHLQGKYSARFWGLVR